MSLSYENNDMTFEQIVNSITKTFKINLTIRQVKYAVEQLRKKLPWFKTKLLIISRTKKRLLYLFNKQILDIYRLLQQNYIYIKSEQESFIKEVEKMIKSANSFNGNIEDLLYNGVTKEEVYFVNNMIDRVKILISQEWELQDIMRMINGNMEVEYRYNSSLKTGRILGLIRKRSGLTNYIYKKEQKKWQRFQDKKKKESNKSVAKQRRKKTFVA